MTGKDCSPGEKRRKRKMMYQQDDDFGSAVRELRATRAIPPIYRNKKQRAKKRMLRPMGGKK